MSSRKAFLTAAAAAALLGAAPAAKAKPKPKASPAPKTSQLARDFAERMREFDPHLSDDQLAKIATGFDANLQLGRRNNPKGEALKNWQEPAKTFEAAQ